MVGNNKHDDLRGKGFDHLLRKPGTEFMFHQQGCRVSAAIELEKVAPGSKNAFDVSLRCKFASDHATDRKRALPGGSAVESLDPDKLAFLVGKNVALNTHNTLTPDANSVVGQMQTALQQRIPGAALKLHYSVPGHGGAVLGSYLVENGILPCRLQVDLSQVANATEFDAPRVEAEMRAAMTATQYEVDPGKRSTVKFRSRSDTPSGGLV